LQSRLGHKAGVCADRWGVDVVRNGPPLGEIVRLGIPFGAGTDSTRGASYNPWRALWWFVTGKSQDGGPRRAEAHRLDRAIALDAYTRGSTWISFEDHRRGVLRPGADADLAVLSADYFAVGEDEIPSVTSDLTVVAGRIVHASGAFPGIPPERHRHRPAPAAASLPADRRPFPYSSK
jgi:predicted amidohydrolase YtcJ